MTLIIRTRKQHTANNEKKQSERKQIQQIHKFT